jgi:hypothetical protein
MFLKPVLDVRMGMRAIVVKDQMQIQAARRLAVDPTQKLQELLVPVTRVTGPDHRPFQDIQRREQRGRPMAFVVMGYRPAAAFFHRQSGLSPVNACSFFHKILGELHFPTALDISSSHDIYSLTMAG